MAYEDHRESEVDRVCRHGNTLLCILFCSHSSWAISSTKVILLTRAARTSLTHRARPDYYTKTAASTPAKLNPKNSLTVEMVPLEGDPVLVLAGGVPDPVDDGDPEPVLEVGG